MLGLTVYADESGTHDESGLQKGSEVTAVAGYIADRKSWEILTRRWNTALREFGIDKAFHMSEYWRGEPPFGAWSDVKRKRCLRTFIKIARDNTWFAIGGMVSTKEYAQILAPKIRDNRLGKLNFDAPYHFCFQMLFVRFMECLKNDIDQRFPRSRERVTFVFDQHQQYAPLAQRNYSLIKRMIDPDDRFASLTFRSKEDCVPLQAADLLAFYARRILTHQHNGKAWSDPFERMLEERHNLLLHYFTPKQMADFAEKITAAEKP